MKPIGLLGGMSWQSTATYYQLINEGVQSRLGGLHSAHILLESIDFAPLEALQAAGDWQGGAALLSAAALRLQAAGAQGLLICTNTMHKVADQVAAAIDVPLLHIADSTGELLNQGRASNTHAHPHTVALLGTAFTMEQGFYKDRLTDKFGLNVLTPNAEERAMVHGIIYDELCLGEIRDDSRQRFLRVINRLAEAGADSIILGCTEIGLLVKQSDTQVPLVDTTAVHAQSAVNFMLN